MCKKLYVSLLTLIVMSFFLIGNLGCGKQVKVSGEKKFTLMVPPFQNKTGDERFDYMAIGLADELSRRLNLFRRFYIIKPSKIFEKITYAQAVGKEREEQMMLRQLRNLNTQYAVLGSVDIVNDGKTIELRAKVIRSTDNVVMAVEREDGDIGKWSALRGIIAVKVARRLGIPLTACELAMLKKNETSDLDAFRLNYVGKMYFYRSMEARYRKVERDALRYRLMAMTYWKQSAARDASYHAPKENYANSMDAGDVRSSINKKIEKAQGSLNGMIMYGFLYKRNRVFNTYAWVKANAKTLREMVKALPAGYIIEVQGHTDSSGPEEPTKDKPGNIAIAEGRAKAVYNAMVRIGIPRGRLTYRGYGSSRSIPWLDMLDPSNRRVSFEVKPLVGR